MRANSTTIFVESAGSVTPVPRNGDIPDWNRISIPSQSLTIIQAAWAEFVASGEALEIIPDPAVVDLPNWTGFNLAMNQNSDFIAWTLPQRIETALISASVNGALEPFKTAFALAQMANPQPIQVLTAWQSIAETYSIPVSLTDF